MSDFWIISSRRFKQHGAFDVAERELHRLSETFPKENFRIYRCKTKLTPSDHVPSLLAAVQNLITVHPVSSICPATADAQRRYADQVRAESDVRDLLAVFSPEGQAAQAGAMK